MAQPRRRHGRIVVAAIIVIGAIAALSITGDLRTVGTRLGSFGWWAFAAAIGLSIANYAIRFGRWALYLRMQAIAVPAASSIGVFVGGLSLAITPGKLGELAKSYLLRELHDVPVTRSAPVVIAERITDVTALVVIAAVGAFAYGVAVVATIVSALVVVALLAVLAWPALAHAIIRVVTAPRFARRFRERLVEIYDGVAALCRPAPLGLATAISTAGWLCECVGFAIVIHAFPGASIDLGLALVIYSVTTLVGAVSFLPGGLGVTEGSMTLLLVESAHGLDASGALAAAVITRLATLWFGVIVGLGGLAWTRRRIAALKADD